MIGIGEFIHVRREEPRQAPREFFWRGSRHEVRSWEGRPRAALRRDGRRLYRVRTSTGLSCMLSEEVGRGLWRLERILNS